MEREGSRVINAPLETAKGLMDTICMSPSRARRSTAWWRGVRVFFVLNRFRMHTTKAVGSTRCRGAVKGHQEGCGTCSQRRVGLYWEGEELCRPRSAQPTFECTYIKLCNICSWWENIVNILIGRCLPPGCFELFLEVIFGEHCCPGWGVCAVCLCSAVVVLEPERALFAVSYMHLLQRAADPNPIESRTEGRWNSLIRTLVV